MNVTGDKLLVLGVWAKTEAAATVDRPTLYWLLLPGQAALPQTSLPDDLAN